MNTHKFVITLNKTLETGVALNAAAHIALGLVNSATQEQRAAMKFIDFTDASNMVHPSISALSLIIMRATNGELHKLRDAAHAAGLHTVDFLETMTGDTYIEQLEKTKSKPTENLIYYGVGIFGAIEDINPLTKKLSLWK
jgi:hypothetical protein